MRMDGVIFDKNAKGITMAIALTKKELKSVVQESVREVLSQERMHLQSLLLPHVSEKEQKNIERLYGKPSHKIAKSRKLNV